MTAWLQNPLYFIAFQLLMIATMFYTSLQQPPEPHQELCFVSLPCKAISLYFCLTNSLLVLVLPLYLYF